MTLSCHQIKIFLICKSCYVICIFVFLVSVDHLELNSDYDPFRNISLTEQTQTHNNHNQMWILRRKQALPTLISAVSLPQSSVFCHSTAVHIVWWLSDEKGVNCSSQQFQQILQLPCFSHLSHFSFFFLLVLCLTGIGRTQHRCAISLMHNIIGEIYAITTGQDWVNGDFGVWVQNAIGVCVFLVIVYTCLCAHINVREPPLALMRKSFCQLFFLSFSGE